METQFTEDGNTLVFNGDVKQLPHCRVCSNEVPHDLLTQEHPYKMKPEESKEEQNVTV